MGVTFTLDMPTLVVARIISIVVFAIAVPIMTLRKGRPETAIFCWSLLMAIMSWVTILASVATRNILVTALYTGCVSATVSLQWAAVVALTGRRINPAWLVVPPIAITVAVMSLQMQPTDAALLSAIVLSIQLAAASLYVTMHGARVVRTSTAILMALGYATSFISAITRPIEAMLFPTVEFSALSGDAANTLPFIASYIGTTLIILSWLAALKDRAEASLADLAFRDELTGLANRRRFWEVGRKLWNRANWQGTAFTMVALDLDYFKKINDRWGHEEGDRVLTAFGRHLASASPTPSVAARMGGEEFCLIYVGVDARMAHDFAEILRDKFAENVRLPDGTPVRFSAGIAQSGPADEGLNSLFRRADTALYEAKASGRDCTIIGAPALAA